MPAPPPIANDRLPHTPAVKLWTMVAALVLLGFAALEGFWRLQGFTPSVTDDEALWSYHRDRVDTAGDQTVVLLGRSRLQQGFVAESFLEAAPGWDYIQLAIGGKHPIAALQDLAVKTDFSGTIVCSITAPSLMPDLWGQQEPYLHYYYNVWGPLKKTSRMIQTWLEDRLTLLLPELILQRILPDLLRGDLAPQFLWTHPDRTQTVLYERVDIEEFTATQLKKISSNLKRYAQLPGYTRFEEHLHVIEGYVKRIQDRGGQVVFLRMPTTGGYRDREQQYFPREKYWDVFAAQTRAQAIHFEDVPVVKDMVCAEGTHLYHDDAKTFTRILAERLTTK